LSEHLTDTQIDQYCLRKLPARELLSVSDHMSGCETCREKMENALAGDSAFFALRSEVFGETVSGPAHPPFDQIAEYVDNDLSGEELQVIQDHLSRCEQCGQAAADLRAFGLPKASARSESWWLRSYPRLAFASVMILLLVAVSLYVWQIRRETGQTVAPQSVSVPVIVEINDGTRRVRLDRDGRLFGLDDLPSEYQRIVSEALTRQQLDKPQLLAELRRPASALMGSGDGRNRFNLIEPLGKVILTDRPVFRWSPLNGAQTYVVEVYDEKFQLAAASMRLTTNSWTAPLPLQRGAIYSWQVKAIKDGQEFIAPRPPAPQARFRILEQTKSEELERIGRNYGSSHLAMALLYVQAGLLDEAEREFRTLQNDNPNSTVVMRLLADVQAMR
jgi:Putative zinc-finger